MSWLEDPQEHGYKSGIISELIYYTVTKAFFVKCYKEIIHLKDDYETAVCPPIDLDHQLANHLAWFSVEYKASKLLTFANMLSESLFLESED